MLLSHPSRSGFILVLVLFLMLLVSGTSVVLIAGLRTFAGDVADLECDVRLRAARRAGVALALSAVDAGWRGRAGEAVPAVSVGGFEVAVAAERPAMRLDVNAADLELVKTVTMVLLPHPLGRDAFEAIAAVRRTGRRVPSIRSLLTPCRRLTADLARLEAVFAVGSGQATLDRLAAPDAPKAAGQEAGRLRGVACGAIAAGLSA